MFTGIIGQTARIARLAPEAGGARLTIAPDGPLPGLQPGESIAINGCCLTLEPDSPPDALRFFLSDETLARTTLGLLKAGTQVNLERALALGERLGGHLVMGHVDGIGMIGRIVPAGEGMILQVRHSSALGRFFAPKGSVAVDGISLTIIESTGEAFTAAVIPHTLAATNLNEATAGQGVNLEIDVLARYALHGLEAMRRESPEEPAAAPKKGGLTLEKLAEAGYDVGPRAPGA